MNKKVKPEPKLMICKYHGETKHSMYSNRWRCNKCLSRNVQLKRDRLKEKAIIYKGNKCCICGYDKCNGALEFHHIDPEQKDFGIGDKGHTRSWQKTKDELDKCIMVCANCHREIHAGLFEGKDLNISNVKGIKEFDKLHAAKKYYCEECGIEVSRYANLCKDCHLKKIAKPSKEEILQQFKDYDYKENPFEWLGKKYKVTGTSVRKWCRLYKLPYKVSEFKNYIKEI